MASFAALVFSGPAQSFEHPIIGGPGGGFFRIYCPPGEFWVGLDGRAGDILDNIRLRCAGFHTEPSTPPRKNWTITTPKHNFGERMGDSDGGSPLRQDCTNNNFVRKIEFNTEFFDGAHLMAFITMTCDHGTVAGVDELPYGFNFPHGTGPQRQVCPEGMWATGLIGRRGFRVDAIGLAFLILSDGEAAIEQAAFGKPDMDAPCRSGRPSWKPRRKSPFRPYGP